MIEIDIAHIKLIQALVLCHKPHNVLELGLGTGQTTQAIFSAMLFNDRGRLTIVDNWYDWQGQVPEHAKKWFENPQTTVCTRDEEAFLKNAPNASYDFIVSDADHLRAQDWLAEYDRVASPEAILVFHDTANPAYPNLAKIQEHYRHNRAVKEFTACSLSSEECGRGLLVVL